MYILEYYDYNNWDSYINFTGIIEISIILVTNAMNNGNNLCLINEDNITTASKLTFLIITLSAFNYS